MRIASKILVLLVLTIATESAFVIAYRSAAEGNLQEAFAAHTAELQSGTIPPAATIDLVNDGWVKVAHFESTFYQIQFLNDVLMSLIVAWILIWGGVSAAIWRTSQSLARNVHVARGIYLIVFILLLSFLHISL